MTKDVILIVDDMDVHRFLIVSSVSKNRDVQVIQANGIANAKIALENNEVSAVLCDWNMPDGDGGVLVDWMREQPKSRDIPFIMISGNNNIEDVIRAFMDYDLDAYVVKPFLPNGLNDKITQAIRRRKKIVDSRGK